MSKFASTKLREIDLGEGEWVKIPTALSYDQVMRFSANSSELETSKNMLKECIREWNLKDDEGKEVELNIENIGKLDIRYITQISNEITVLLVNNQDKKK